MKKNIKKLIKCISRIIEDICIISGLIVINIATYGFGIIPGLYCTGLTLLGLGIYLTKTLVRRG